MEFYLRIRTNFFVQLAGGVIGLTVLFFCTPFMLSVLGAERYGVLLLILGFTTYAGLAELGVGVAAARELAGAQDDEARSLVQTNALILSVFFGFIAGSLLALLSFADVAKFLSIEPETSTELSNSGAALFLLGVGGVLLSIPSAVLLGTSRYLSLNVLGVVSSTSASVAPVLYATVGTDLYGLIFSVAGSRFFSFIIGLVLCRYTENPVRFGRFDFEIQKQLVKYGSSTTASGITHRFLNGLDRPMIAAILGPAYVSFFAVPQAMLTRSHVVVGALTSATFPRLVAAVGGKEEEVLVCKLLKSVFVVAPLYIIGTLLLAPVLEMWLGAVFATSAASCAIILGAATWFDAVAHVPYLVMQARANVGKDILISSTICLPNAALLFLGLYYGGLEGAALVSLLRSIVVVVWRLHITNLTAVQWLEFSFHSIFIVAASILTITTLTFWEQIIISFPILMISAAVASWSFKSLLK